MNRISLARAASVLLIALVAAPTVPALTLFEAPGLTLGDDPVECVDLGSYRLCESDAGSERLLSHDALPPAERIPLDFHLFLPPAPTDGSPDGGYPLVVFLHGWSGSRYSTGGGVESQFVPYAEGGYAVLAYSARAWGNSCGSSQQNTPECAGQWNHLADARYEVRDTQYLAGVLADEPSDDGTPLVDGLRVGVTGVSYGGGQSTILASLRDRVVDPDGSVGAWTSPSGRPMRIAAAAPYWAWTDLAYSLLPNGGTLDYASNNAYRGPDGGLPFGVMKTSYVSGLYATGKISSVYAPPTGSPPLDVWYQIVNGGEPYTEADLGPVVDELDAFHSGITWVDPDVPPAPTLFNSGWSDDLFPVSEPLRWINRVRALHPDVPTALVASDYGHARAGSTDAGWAWAAAREWFDHHLLGVGPEPGPGVRARVQVCGGPAAVIEGDDWESISAGEVRLLRASGGTVVSSAGPGTGSTGSHDPISGGNACARAADGESAGAAVFDLPAATAGGYTLLGSPTLIAELVVIGAPHDSAMLVARLLDVDPSGAEMLLARHVLRPRDDGRLVLQMNPIAHELAEGHRLQLELLGHEAPTHRQSNVSFSIQLGEIDLRVPVYDAPDGVQIEAPAAAVLPDGYQFADACAGRPCAAGRMPDGADVAGQPLTLGTSGSQLVLGWGQSCDTGDTDYAVYAGPLGRFDEHAPVACSTGGVGVVTLDRAEDSRYFIVVSRSELREGSYGRDHSGAERPPAAAPCLNSSPPAVCP